MPPYDLFARHCNNQVLQRVAKCYSHVTDQGHHHAPTASNRFRQHPFVGSHPGDHAFMFLRPRAAGDIGRPGPVARRQCQRRARVSRRGKSDRERHGLFTTSQRGASDTPRSVSPVAKDTNHRPARDTADTVCTDRGGRGYDRTFLAHPAASNPAPQSRLPGARLGDR